MLSTYRYECQGLDFVQPFRVRRTSMCGGRKQGNLYLPATLLQSQNKLRDLRAIISASKKRFD